MEEKSVISRSVVPVAIVLAIMALSYAGYHNAHKIGSDIVYRVMVNISAFSLFFSISLPALFIYPRSYRGGAGLPERVAASLFVPAVWAVKEVYRVTLSFPLAESLYFIVNPLIIAAFCAAAAEMGLSEYLVRRGRKKAGEDLSLLPMPALLAIVVGVGLIVFMFSWGLGVHTFYIYQEGYKAIFGTGV